MAHGGKLKKEGRAAAKPKKGTKAPVPRTIVIGDVHGCARELALLLEKLRPTRGDRVFMVGDLVMRGPAPNEVLKLVRAVGAVAVCGNHELRLLKWRELQQSRRQKKPAVLGEYDERLFGNKMLRATAAEIDEDGWDQLARMPLWIEIPEQELVVVHAGVMPGVKLAKQDPHNLLYMRGITKDGEATEKRDEGVPWGKKYLGPNHVVFGHNAQPKPQLHRFATGIDTGCVYGGRLTALVLPEGRTVPKGTEARKKLLVSVKAARTYQAIKK